MDTLPSDGIDRRGMDSSALAPGTRLGEMEVLRVIAVGGFGIVYLARDHSLDRDVAVKEFMPARLVGRKDGERVTVRSLADATTFQLGLKSFVNEARLLAKFSHPAVVKVYRFWEANGTAYMAMPHLRGPTLKDVRRSMTGPPTEAWLRSVIDPLLDALDMLHAEGYYHRDIAPDNVLLPGPGQPVLLDFGAARQVIADRTQSITAVLKPNYAPIEQYAESRQLRQGPWTDLYALGALTKYLLDGTAPPVATARSIHDEMDPLAGRRVANVSPKFLRAIDWALAVRPADRPQNVQALRDALEGRVVPPRRRPIDVLAAPADAMPAAAPSPRGPSLIRFGRVPTRRVVALVGVAAAAAIAWVVSAHIDKPAPPPAGQLVSAPVQPAAPPVSVPPVEARASAPEATPVAMFTPTPPVVEAPAPVPVQQPLVPPRAESDSRVQAPVVKTRPTPPRSPPRKRTAATPAFTIGPVELCSGRNFFMRPYCIQSRCDEPRFKAHAQCVQVRQAARIQRD
jgi:hypothetical protein